MEKIYARPRKDPKVDDLLRDWLKENSLAYLAWRLGYSDTQALFKWKTRGVPLHMVKQVREILESFKNEELTA